LVVAAVLTFVSVVLSLAVLICTVVGVALVRSRRDAASVLSAFVLVLIALPSDVVITGLGGAGSPTLIFGLIILVWWGSSRMVHGAGSARGRQPVRTVLYVFLGAVVLSYAAAFGRSIPGVEVQGADRALLTMLAMGGVALLCADGLDSLERLDTLLRRLVLGASALASIGILQFATGVDIAGLYDHLPGVSFNLPVQFIEQRSHFRRVQGTAAHPIEFGVVLAMVLPLAVHYALHDRRHRPLVRWLPVALIGVAIPMSISRSAILGLAVGGVVLLAGWSWRRRARAVVVAAVAVVGMRFLVPGLIGTIVGGFLHASTDPSVVHREQDLQTVSRFVSEYPILGRGVGTYIPQEFVTAGVPLPSLDNQYYGTLVEMGYVGLAALLALLATMFITPLRARARAADPETAHLGMALASASAVAIASFFTFDLFSFSMATGLVFLLLGSTGALWRLAPSPRQSDEAAPAASMLIGS